MLASGAWSAAALAKSRTIEALVLNRSGFLSVLKCVIDGSQHTITSHARLAGNTSGNKNDLCALEGLGETRRCRVISADLVFISERNGLRSG